MLPHKPSLLLCVDSAHFQRATSRSSSPPTRQRQKCNEDADATPDTLESTPFATPSLLRSVVYGRGRSLIGWRAKIYRLARNKPAGERDAAAITSTFLALRGVKYFAAQPWAAALHQRS